MATNTGHAVVLNVVTADARTPRAWLHSANRHATPLLRTATFHPPLGGTTPSWCNRVVVGDKVQLLQCESAFHYHKPSNYSFFDVYACIAMTIASEL
ncbi:hypothetical protein TSMEX_004918 [Taenia solium]|eukprot:TsM_000440500 transcript=TsM_000440500 gene=TsM_000440500